jgi:hypothetical protein
VATYQIAIVLDVEANSYEEALQTAIDFNGQLSNSDPTFDNVEITGRVQDYYEHDGSELEQRVLYLHNEKHSADYDPDADANASED